MFRTWRKLTSEQRKIWRISAGIMVGGTIFKTLYFTFTRQLLVDDADRRHKRALQNLEESREFAEKNAEKREKEIPKLSPEEEKQMREYLSLMQEHELSKYGYLPGMYDVDA